MDIGQIYLWRWAQCGQFYCGSDNASSPCDILRCLAPTGLPWTLGLRPCALSWVASLWNFHQSSGGCAMGVSWRWRRALSCSLAVAISAWSASDSKLDSLMRAAILAIVLLTRVRHCDQKPCTISKVATEWDELMILQCTMCTSKQLDTCKKNSLNTMKKLLCTLTFQLPRYVKVFLSYSMNFFPKLHLT